MVLVQISVCVVELKCLTVIKYRSWSRTLSTQSDKDKANPGFNFELAWHLKVDDALLVANIEVVILPLPAHTYMIEKSYKRSRVVVVTIERHRGKALGKHYLPSYLPVLKANEIRPGLLLPFPIYIHSHTSNHHTLGMLLTSGHT